MDCEDRINIKKYYKKKYAEKYECFIISLFIFITVNIAYSGFITYIFANR